MRVPAVVKKYYLLIFFSCFKLPHYVKIFFLSICFLSLLGYNAHIQFSNSICSKHEHTNIDRHSNTGKMSAASTTLPSYRAYAGYCYKTYGVLLHEMNQCIDKAAKKGCAFVVFDFTKAKLPPAYVMWIQDSFTTEGYTVKLFEDAGKVDDGKPIITVLKIAWARHEDDEDDDDDNEETLQKYDRLFSRCRCVVNADLSVTTVTNMKKFNQKK